LFKREIRNWLKGKEKRRDKVRDLSREIQEPLLKGRMRREAFGIEGCSR